MLDAHCHIQFEEFDGMNPVDESRVAGLSGLVVADFDSNRRGRARTLAERRGVWACCGLHPWAVGTSGRDVERELELVRSAFADQTDWVAVGEFGLDASSRHKSTMELQRSVAEAHLEIACDVGLPVVLHIVRAHDAMIELLERFDLPAGGMCHGFSGTPEQARVFVDLGLHISIGTNAVRGNVGRVREVCRAIERGRLLVETDSPDRPPDGVDAPNHPRYLSRVIEAVADFTGDEPETIATTTEENARALFGLGDETL